MNALYPPKPLNADSVSIAPSASFKKEVVGVLGSIILFFIVYVLLVIAATWLAVSCFYWGVGIMLAMGSFLGIILGIGLMALGVSIVFFLVKFVFAQKKSDNSSRVEVTEEEQPRLFAFIRELTTETQTPFPKKIFISPQVNASVFYNSSFWSMFFPVKKNLEIGLGLVNAINMGEFKAVMAHEFGHFSQRSMKLGSFTYNVNQVIHNMLFDNNSYSSALRAWGNIHWATAIFAQITVVVAQGIQWILRQMYTLVNKRYLSLSREMEFHADAVAASVAGGNNLVTALNRIELAGNCYQETMNNLNDSLSRKEASRNLFANQQVVMQQFAQTHLLPLSNGLPVITSAFTASLQNSRINFKNQWASHPTNEEREAKLNALGLAVATTETRAWELFDSPRALQEQLTNNLYQGANIALSELTYYDEVAFKQEYETTAAAWRLPEAYRDFFEGRYPELSLLDTTPQAPELWESINTPENRALPKQYKHTEADLKLMEAIVGKESGIETFDFDGQKYKTKEAGPLVTQLRNETADLKKQLDALDKQLLIWLYQKNPAGLAAFEQWTTLNTDFEKVGKEVMSILQVFYSGNQLTLEEVNQHIASLKNVHEPAFKAVLQQLIDYRLIHNESLKKEVELFLINKYVYFTGSSFNNEDLSTLHKLLQQVAEWIAKQRFAAFKEWMK
jgi:Zn-dependent protease with chaperone function